MKKRKTKRKKNKKPKRATKRTGFFSLPIEVRHKIFCVTTLLFALVVILSFFDAAGAAGRLIKNLFIFLIGEVYFVFPVFLTLGALSFWSKKLHRAWHIVVAILLLTMGISGILGAIELNKRVNFGKFVLGYSGQGGWIGNIESWPLLKIFGFWVTQAIFITVTITGGLIIWHFLNITKKENKEEIIEEEEAIPINQTSKKRNTLPIKNVSQQKINVKKIETESPVESLLYKEKPLKRAPKKDKESSSPFILETHSIERSSDDGGYVFPPLSLLNRDKGTPNSGDTRVNSAIIKRTLQNFDIQVEMSEVNIGPTVTQYTFKPAAGIKLSKITSLANDLSLALAAHPIRIEAPIPGRPLVGIEIPNKSRTMVRLGSLLSNPGFLNSISPLILALGRDVSGNPVFADLTHMPHLLVAGSTGAGKTVCLNNIILSLLYRNCPNNLRLILVDPKRVEFPVYNGIPHLIVPAIVNTQKAVNALKWLVGEMERRFEALSSRRARDIIAYNKIMVKEGIDPMPYIVLVIDELADLMASRGRDIESYIVRLAQMARAVGIHLVVATQRPSVRVITGLIKANITSRIAFQVASQIDSRTILDSSGAEKLLGAGDMLFVSADISKPKRIQGAYVSDKEVKSVVAFIKSKSQKIEEEENKKDNLSESLENDIKEEKNDVDISSSEEDPLYEEAKRVVIESKKASASLLQRRLRVGYARAARLIDMLEERGVVGPGEGAKPREVYFKSDEENDGWHKI